MERQWKLNKDLSTYDSVLDGFTFDDIILSLYTGEKIIDKKAIKKVVKDILESQFQDMNFLIDNNIDEILSIAKNNKIEV